MANNFIYKKTKDIEACATNHGVGRNIIFINKNDCQSSLTQAALGKLKSGEKIEQHVHHSMEEFYYFESGKLNFHVADKMFGCEAGDFIMVPAGAKHFIEVQQTAHLYTGASALN